MVIDAVPRAEGEVYLSASIAGEGVVPQALVRAGDGLLLVVVVGEGGSCHRSEGGEEVQHLAAARRGDVEWREHLDGEEEERRPYTKLPTSSPLHFCSTYLSRPVMHANKPRALPLAWASLPKHHTSSLQEHGPAARPGAELGLQNVVRLAGWPAILGAAI